MDLTSPFESPLWSQSCLPVPHHLSLTRPWPSGDLIPDAAHPGHRERSCFSLLPPTLPLVPPFLPKPVKTVFLRHYCPQVGQASTSTCLSAGLSEPDVVTAASSFLSFSRETPEASQLTNSAQHANVALPPIPAWLMWLLIYCIEEVLFVGPSVDLCFRLPLCDQLDLPAFWKIVESVAVVLPFETLDGWMDRIMFIVWKISVCYYCMS